MIDVHDVLVAHAGSWEAALPQPADFDQMLTQALADQTLTAPIATRRRWLMPLIAAAAVVALAGGLTVASVFGRSGGHEVVGPGTGASPSLTPSIPGIFRTGVNHCGNPYRINATTLAKTIPLLDCPGNADLEPLPSIDVNVGGQVLISGLPRTASLTIDPQTLMTRTGDTFTALHPGRTVITIHNYRCAAPPHGHQPTSCPLITIEAR